MVWKILPPFKHEFFFWYLCSISGISILSPALRNKSLGPVENDSLRNSSMVDKNQLRRIIEETYQRHSGVSPVNQELENPHPPQLESTATIETPVTWLKVQVLEKVKM